MCGDRSFRSCQFDGYGYVRHRFYEQEQSTVWRRRRSDLRIHSYLKFRGNAEIDALKRSSVTFQKVRASTSLRP